MIAAMSTRPVRHNRRTCSRMSVPIALTPPPPCEPVHMRCAPMRRTRAHRRYQAVQGKALNLRLMENRDDA
jgi:hypothetical protein